MRTLFLSALVALISIAGSGCQSSTAPTAQAKASPERALVVTGGNGGNTTVFLSSDDPAKPVMLCTSGTAVCPECEAAAVKYFQTGVLDPKCSLTGATRTAVVGSPPNHSHN